MQKIRFKLPMTRPDFDAWIASPFQAAQRDHAAQFAVRAVKDGVVQQLIAYFNFPEVPAECPLSAGPIISFSTVPLADDESSDDDDFFLGSRSKPTRPKKERRESPCFYTQRSTVQEAFAFFEELCLAGNAPEVDGWKLRDDDLMKIEEMALIVSARNALTKPYDAEKPLAALKALEAHDLKALEALLDAGLETDCMVPYPKNEEVDTPLFARYFYEDGDLAFGLEAIAAFKRRGFWLGANPNDEFETFCALSHRADAPLLLDVWKALLDLDRPFAFTEMEAQSWIETLDEVLIDTIADIEGNLEFEKAQVLRIASGISSRAAEGLPYAGIGGLEALAGRKLSRILLTKSPRSAEAKLYETEDMHGNAAKGYTGMILLDFEGLFAVAEAGYLVYTDLEAEKLFTETQDVSGEFSAAIGKRLISSSYATEDEYSDSLSSTLIAIHTFVFEDGAELIVSGLNTGGDCLRAFKRDWGEYRVMPDGILERPISALHLTLWDVYSIQRAQLDDWICEGIADGNLPLRDFLDQAWAKWWSENRKKKSLRTWRSVMRGKADPKAKDALKGLFEAWLDKPAPEDGSEREELDVPYTTDRGVAVESLKDIPEPLAEALGLVWPEGLYRGSAETAKVGVKLTKTAEEANAIAREHGWQISFKPVA